MTQAGRDAVAAFAGRLAALRAQTETARAALANTTASATSSDGAVRITVDVGGVLTDVQLGPAARNLSPAELAASVLRTTHEAHIAVLREAERRVADTVGESSEAVAVLRRQRAELDERSVASDANDDGTDGGFTGRGW